MTEQTYTINIQWSIKDYFIISSAESRGKRSQNKGLNLIFALLQL